MKIFVGAGAEAVDFKPISLCHQGDIVVTQDIAKQQWLWVRRLMQSISRANGIPMRIAIRC